jgi:hypothetical protein
LSGSDRTWALVDLATRQISSELIDEINQLLTSQPNAAVEVIEVASNACVGMMLHPVRFAARLEFGFPAKFTVSSVDMLVGHPNAIPRRYSLWRNDSSSSSDDVDSEQAQYQLDKLYFADHRLPAALLSSTSLCSSSASESNANHASPSCDSDAHSDADVDTDAKCDSDEQQVAFVSSGASVAVRPRLDDAVRALQRTAIQALESINLARTIPNKLAQADVIMELVCHHLIPTSTPPPPPFHQHMSSESNYLVL